MYKKKKSTESHVQQRKREGEEKSMKKKGVFTIKSNNKYIYHLMYIENKNKEEKKKQTDCRLKSLYKYIYIIYFIYMIRKKKKKQKKETKV